MQQNKTTPVDFNLLNLSTPILKAVKEKGYKTPTPIQAQAIPAIMTGQDLMAAAQTGTGKTAGFTLPILEKLIKSKPLNGHPIRTLILTPTRELAAQINESVITYGKHLPFRSTVVFGGVKINPQIQILKRGVDILVATPGRLLDLFNQRFISFKHLEIFVLDEADRMLDMGFIHDIKKILAILPKKRQNLMFSATFSKEIRQLAKGLINNPIEISVNPRNTTVEAIKQYVYQVDKRQKSALLTHLINENSWQRVLVFTRTKHGANKLTKYLEKEKISAVAIHGNKSQSARTQALENFKNGEIRILVATDIAARGIDINELPQVVNFDLPNIPIDYVHRIGRTGRAHRKGSAISLVSADEFEFLRDIERLIKLKIERKTIDTFKPVHIMPNLSQRNSSSKNNNRNKNFKSNHRDGQRFAGSSKKRKQQNNKYR